MGTRALIAVCADFPCAFWLSGFPWPHGCPSLHHYPDPGHPRNPRDSTEVCSDGRATGTDMIILVIMAIIRRLIIIRRRKGGVESVDRPSQNGNNRRSHDDHDLSAHQVHRADAGDRKAVVWDGWDSSGDRPHPSCAWTQKLLKAMSVLEPG